MLILKRKSFSKSPTTIYGNVNTKGDAAVGGNSKIVKTESKKLSLFEILVGIIGLIGSIITIYLFFNGNQ